MPAPEDIAGIKARLMGERAKLLQSFAELSPALLQRAVRQEGWSIKDTLAHTAMAEEVNVKFAALMVAQDTPVQLAEFARAYPDFPGEFNLDQFNNWMAERWRVKTLDQVLTALHDVRAATVAWIDTLSPEQLERTGEHAVWGKQSVYGMLRILVIHDRYHRADIEKIAQALCQPPSLAV